MSKILCLMGGWPGHSPRQIREWTATLLTDMEQHDVTWSQDPFVLDGDLGVYDLIILGYNNALTTDDLSDAQENGLHHAVSTGTGLVAWHGAAAAFRASLMYHEILGGSFLEHPAGEGHPQPYRVTITDTSHPITRGVHDFDVASEQFYMQVDPNNHILAETVFTGEHRPWLEGLRMPQAWTRHWGAGKVFYHSIGHFPTDLDNPDVRRLTAQAITWAMR